MAGYDGIMYKQEEFYSIFGDLAEINGNDGVIC